MFAHQFAPPLAFGRQQSHLPAPHMPWDVVPRGPVQPYRAVGGIHVRQGSQQQGFAGA
jgi:hypothetical protein